MTCNIILGRYKLAVCLNRRRGRPSKSFIKHTQESFLQFKKIATDKRYAGHPLSRVFRRAFESKKSKRILGINLMAITLLSGVVVSPTSALVSVTQEEITNISPHIVQMTTELSVRMPVDNPKITQNFRTFHPGIDLAQPVGASIYPIMDGIVESVAYSRFSYGNHIIINHGSGFKSLYAHLSKINVKENDQVDKNTIIGLVGSSGWSTGPHLHLEVHDNGRPFNPLTILK